MSGKFLKAFFEMVDIPSPVVPSVVETYKAHYASNLAVNGSLGDHLAEIAKCKLPVQATTALLRTGNLAAFDAVLTTRDHRDYVMNEILGYWTICEQDQVRLATRALSTSIADQILTQNLAPAAKAIAALRASVPSHMKWLNSVELSEEEALVHLSSLAKKGASVFLALVPLLLAYPNLRSSALRSPDYQLFAAACWTELTEADQLFALDRAIGPRFLATTHDPIIGLLGQPSLALVLRQRLWEVAAHEGIIGAARSTGIRAPGAAIYVGRPLAEVDDTGVLDALLDAFAVVPRDFASTALGQSVLFELGCNPHLSASQLSRLAYALCQYAKGSWNGCLGMLHIALSKVAHRLDSGVAPSLTLANYGAYSDTTTILDRSAPEPYVGSETSYLTQGPRPRNDYSRYGHNSAGHPELAKVTTLADNRVLLYQIRDIVPAALGRGETEQSVRAWMTFFGLTQDDPDVPLTTVLDTAKRLATATN